MKASNCARVLAVFAMVVLAVSGCSKERTLTSAVKGSSPDYLAGVWLVQDEVAECFPFALWTEKNTFTDTICIGGPDFVSLNALAIWGMHLTYQGIIPGRWRPLEVRYCSGIISDTLINVFCEAWTGSDLESCDFAVRIYTRGTPNGDTWTLLRTVERIEGQECGQRPGDSLYECSTYMSVLTRVGDALIECPDGDSLSTIGWW